MSITSTIQVTRRNKYGTDFFHPANDQAENACALWGQKTLTLVNMGALKKMGFTIDEIIVRGDKRHFLGEL